VIRSLDRIIQWPGALRVEDSPDHIRCQQQILAAKPGFPILRNLPGQPQRNA